MLKHLRPMALRHSPLPAAGLVCASGAAVDADALNPQPAIVDDWAAGVVESWSGELDVHLAASGDVSHRLWIAQLATIFPILERLRVAVIERVVDFAIGRGMNPSECDGLGDLELGVLRDWQAAELPNLDRRLRDAVIGPAT